MLGIQHSIACAADAVAILGHYIPPFLQGIQITFNSQFQCSISSNLKSVVFKVQFQNSDLKFSFNSSGLQFTFKIQVVYTFMSRGGLIVTATFQIVI